MNVLLWTEYYEPGWQPLTTEEMYQDFVANSPIVVPRNKVRIEILEHKDEFYTHVLFWEKDHGNKS